MLLGQRLYADGGVTLWTAGSLTYAGPDVAGSVLYANGGMTLELRGRTNFVLEKCPGLLGRGQPCTGANWS